MNCTVSGKDFSNALALARPIMDMKSELHYIKYLKIYAAEGHLTVEASNLVSFVRVTMAARVSDPGVVFVSPTPVDTFMMLPGDDEISMESQISQASGMVLKSGHSRVTASILAENPWPDWPDIEEGSSSYELTKDEADGISIAARIGSEGAAGDVMRIGIGERLHISATDRRKGVLVGRECPKFSDLSASMIRKMHPEEGDFLTIGHRIHLQKKNVEYAFLPITRMTLDVVKLINKAEEEVAGWVKVRSSDVTGVMRPASTLSRLNVPVWMASSNNRLWFEGHETGTSIRASIEILETEVGSPSGMKILLSAHHTNDLLCDAKGDVWIGFPVDDSRPILFRMGEGGIVGALSPMRSTAAPAVVPEPPAPDHQEDLPEPD